MAKSVIFNPFTGNFDYIDQVSLAAVGSSPNANAASVAGNVLTLQPADGTNPGVLTAVSQTIGGAKTFTGAISASNLSGTNTGDVTLTAVGSSPNANAASLSGQALTIQPASGSFPGVVTTASQTFAGAKTFSSAVDVSNNKITSVATPAADTDAANKVYVDNLVNGLSWKSVVRSATTGVLPTYTYSNGASGVGATITAIVVGALPAQDGVTMAPGDRLLVKNEVVGNAPYNGIYIVTVLGSVGAAFILTRASDMDQAAEFIDAVVQVSPEASTQAGYGYRQNADPVTVGTTAISFSNFNIGVTYTFTSGTQLSGSTVSANVDNSTIAVTANQLVVKTNGVANAQLAQMATLTIKGNNTGGTANALDLTVSQVQTMLAVPTASSPLSLAAGGTGISAGSANAAFNALSPMTTLGDTIYGGASGAGTRLAGNITTAKQFLSQTGNGAVSAAPAWASLAASDILSGTLPEARGGTNQSTYATGDILYASGANTLAKLAIGSTGTVLKSNGTIPGWASASSTFSVATATGTTTLTGSNNVVLASGDNYVITLPSAASNAGQQLLIQKTDGLGANGISITRAGSDTIGNSGATSVKLQTQDECYTLVSDGVSKWAILNHETDTGWTAFTPTGSYTTNTVYTGMWRRISDSVEIIWYIAFSGNPNNPNPTNVNLPSNMVIDTTKILTTTTSQNNLGTVVGEASSTNPFGFCVYASTTAVSLRAHNAANTQLVDWTGTSPVSFANGNSITVRSVALPISGWSP